MKPIIIIFLISILFSTIRNPIPGDVNGDNQTNIFDILIILNWIMDEYDPTDEELEIADLSGDNSLDIIDIIIIVHCILYNDCVGCTDPYSNNLDPDAVLDDMTCEYFDIDGNIFTSLLIGEQRWMAKNLNVTHYLNGDEIPTGFIDEEWGYLEITATGD